MDPNTLKLLMGSAGAGAVADKIYIEDAFSTYLYTGNGSTQTITNGIDLSGKGGLVWLKNRNRVSDQYWIDTARGAANALFSNTTGSQAGRPNSLTAFTSTGFTLSSEADVNNSGEGQVSWTFRKAAKFFDVVTYTGNGSNRTIAHSLGSVPGCIIVKKLDSTGGDESWAVYHRSTNSTNELRLNSTLAAFASATTWNNTEPTSSVFSVGTGGRVNTNGSTYVAYLFAHDAGGFGDSGNDNVISCGSVTTNGSGQIPTVNLGWEPQWLIMKNTTSAGNWDMYDTMRGWVSQDQNQFNRLSANGSSAEATGVNGLAVITSTGFRSNTLNFGASQTYIYIAIRRGPMKTPTDATKVFALSAGQDDTSPPVTKPGFLVDAAFSLLRTLDSKYARTRLTGGGYLSTNAASSEAISSYSWASNTDLSAFFLTGSPTVYQMFRRAPGFFDVVAYTGTGSVSTVSHNLGVAPELMIVKCRSIASNWAAYDAANGPTNLLTPNSTDASAVTAGPWNNTAPSSTQFTVGTISRVNSLSERYIAYLFATCPGVSKVGSYTGTGTTQQINCGFTNGARFVLIKRTDSTGDWYVWDTARGIVSGNDPFLLLNSTAAENTSTDYIDPLSTGFEISSTAPAAINANGGTYIYLSVA